jgi:endonuclease I
MKKVKGILALLAIVLGGTFYATETYLDIDLLEYIIPDTSEPVIDITSIRTTVTLDGLFDTSEVTCDDNKDDTCDIEVIGSVNTSVLGSQTITFQATDSAGNTAVEVITIEIIEGINTTMYVPLGYYNDAIGLTGESLKDALNDIITGHTEFPYTDKDLDDMDVWKMLRDGDEDPDNNQNVVLFYSEFSWPKECQDTNTDLLPDYCFDNDDREADYIEWNREHIWSKSHGDFEDEDGYEFEDSFGGYALGAHTDAHHLVAAERSMNSIKNNRFFDDCHDGINDDNLVDRDFGNYTCGDWYFEPRDDMKGDVARMLFYMATRYEGEDGDYVDLELTTDLFLYEDSEIHIKNSRLPYYESLEILLKWHLEDPVDEWELERNETIYQYQGNRNPFIDHPEYVALIWGTFDNPIEYRSTSE